ncbi:MAG: DUF1501 domain-containing protein [Pirellulaceae bacterium]|nr:DUF1501 domain-containing protein [Pirellulaceae bacterium]
MNTNRNCEGMSRRSCLQLGLGAFGGGGLLSLMGLRAQAAKQTGATPETRCILIWLDGGPSHFETFDPKPEAPEEIRGELGTIGTKIPGVRFGEYLPRLAGITDKLAVIRSVQHNQGNHGAGNHYMMTGAPPRIPVGCGAFVSFHPSMGSVTAHERGMQNGMPAYFSLPSMTRSGGPNFLGANFAPFVVGGDPNNKNFRLRDVALPHGLTDERFHQRQDLRGIVDHFVRITDRAAADPAVALDQVYSQGYDLVTSPAAQAAFDINQEDDKVRDAYGRNDFGQRVLLARRLIEAGVPFVTINDGGWDHHSEIFPKMRDTLPNVDAALSSLLTDLEDRGLLDSTLVMMLGEFGRTPKISTLADRKTPGRDHWANAMSILFAGCGTPGGQIIGATDRNGYAACERILSPENFVSTVYRKLGIDPGQIYHAPNGRPVHLVSDPEPIAELMG